jgi:hypothetical protein
MRKLGLGLGLTVRALDIFFFMADINQSPVAALRYADNSILRRARRLWSRELTNHEKWA